MRWFSPPVQPHLRSLVQRLHRQSAGYGLRRPATTLVSQTMSAMLGFVVALELLFAIVALLFVLLPVAERSAHDLAGLMVVAARTWADLPPDSRPAFAHDLESNYGLRIARRLPASTAHPPLRGFYVAFLEKALRARTGMRTSLTQERDASGHTWWWTGIAYKGSVIPIGFDADRIQPQPLRALLLSQLLSLPLAAALAWWWTRRITRPVAAMERAAAILARGETPDLLPERGPRELCRLAAHFNYMAKQIRTLLQARTVLLAGVSHDLRTPLARMRLAIEMQRLAPNDTRLNQIDRDIATMDALIAQLLRLARGLESTPATDFALRPWLLKLTAEWGPLLNSHGSTLLVDCAQGLQIHADATDLYRLLDNLVSNAIRYAPGELLLRAAPSSYATVRLEVLDRGPGMSESQRASIFQVFRRFEPAQGSTSEGAGLGMAIVKQLAQIHGWSVGVDAREGGGLCAWVEVPKALDEI